MNQEDLEDLLSDIFGGGGFGGGGKRGKKRGGFHQD